jgi:hypothetical protein
MLACKWIPIFWRIFLPLSSGILIAIYLKDSMALHLENHDLNNHHHGNLKCLIPREILKNEETSLLIKSI